MFFDLRVCWNVFISMGLYIIIFKRYMLLWNESCNKERFDLYCIIKNEKDY